MQTDRFQHVDGASCVDLEIVKRIVDAAGHGDLRSEVQHRTRLAYRIDDRNGIADVRDSDPDPLAMSRFQPLRIFPHARARKVIDDKYIGAAGCQPIGEIAADEAAPAGNQYGPGTVEIEHHATNPRSSNSCVAF